MIDVKKRIEELIEIANKATPGDWVIYEEIKMLDNCTLALIRGPKQYPSGWELQDARFVTTFNPAFVLNLLESWIEMREALEALNNKRDISPRLVKDFLEMKAAKVFSDEK